MSSAFHSSSVRQESKQEQGMHTVPITREQANFMLDYVKYLYDTKEQDNYITLRHISTTRTHSLKMIHLGESTAPLYYATQGTVISWHDWFTGHVLPITLKDDMLDILTKEYETPVHFVVCDKLPGYIPRPILIDDN
jgi:hypothetical protein